MLQSAGLKRIYRPLAQIVWGKNVKSCSNSKYGKQSKSAGADILITLMTTLFYLGLQGSDIELFFRCAFLATMSLHSKTFSKKRLTDKMLLL